MATIQYIQTPDGVTHNIGGGGGSNTYTLTKSGNTITLTGSGGDVSSVIDANTTYSLSLSGNTLTLTPSSGSAQSVTLPNDDTTYTISISGSTITLTPSSGSAQSVTIPNATTSSAGVMSASDKSKLNGIESGAEANVQSDWAQSDSTADDYIKNKPNLATVATSGNYNDLTNKPSLATVATTGDYDDLTNKPSLSTVATTGDYDDLTNKPTIPTVNDGTLTIQKNGTTIDSFTANQSGNTTVNVTVPTKTSDLTNDSDFVSDANYVHTDNNFTNAEKSKLSGISPNAKDVSVTQVLSSGTKIAEVDIDGTTTDLYAPSGGGGGAVNDVEVNGVSVVTGGVAEVTVPTKTSDLTNDSDFVSDANYVHTDNNFTNNDVTKLNGIESGAEVNVQADWEQTDPTADDYIKNKPTDTMTYGRMNSMTSSVSLTTNEQKLPLTNLFGVGCTEYDNGIRIDEEGVYVVSAAAYFTTGFTVGDIMHVKVKVNTTDILNEPQRATNAAAYDIVRTGPLVRRFIEGDVIRVYVYNQGGNRGTVNDNYTAGLNLYKISYAVNTVFDPLIYDSSADTYSAGIADRLLMKNDTISAWESILGVTGDGSGILDRLIDALAYRVSYAEANVDGSNKTLSNNTVTNLVSVTLPKGTYLLVGACTFSANSTGRRGLYFGTASNQAGNSRYTQLEVANAGSSEVHPVLTTVWTVTAASATVYLNARQNSGGSLTVTSPGIKYIKLIGGGTL